GCGVCGRTGTRTDMDTRAFAEMRTVAEQLCARTTPETLTPDQLRYVGRLLLEMVDAMARMQEDVQAMREREQDLLDQVETLRALHAGALAAVAQWAPRDYH